MKLDIEVTFNNLSYISIFLTLSQPVFFKKLPAGVSIFYHFFLQNFHGPKNILLYEYLIPKQKPKLLIYIYKHAFFFYKHLNVGTFHKKATFWTKYTNLECHVQDFTGIRGSSQTRYTEGVVCILLTMLCVILWKTLVLHSGYWRNRMSANVYHKHCLSEDCFCKLAPKINWFCLVK